MTEPTNHELIEAIARVDISKPPPVVDPDTIVGRGRRSLRRRRLAAVSGAVGLVAAAAVTATLIANSVTPAQPPIAETPTRPTQPVSTRAADADYLDPMPGVGQGDAALRTISKAEAQRRCTLRNPGKWKLGDVVGPYRGGAWTVYGGGPYGMPTGDGPDVCTIPGDVRPTAAGQALLRTDPMPATLPDRLLNCSVQLWHDVRSWRVITSDELPGVEARVALRSPSGRFVATCVLAPPARTPDPTPGQDQAVSIRAVTTGGPRNSLAHIGSAGAACDGLRAPCTGWLRQEFTRIRGDVVRLVLTSTDGTTHEVKVVDGWLALVWADPSGNPSLGGLKAYDASGKVVYQR